jgi:hypothetical protein
VGGGGSPVALPLGCAPWRYPLQKAHSVRLSLSLVALSGRLSIPNVLPQFRMKILFKTWWPADKAKSPHRARNSVVHYVIRDSAIPTTDFSCSSYTVLVARKFSLLLNFLRYRFYLIYFFHKISITAILWSPEVGDRPPHCHSLGFVFCKSYCLWNWRCLARK